MTTARILTALALGVLAAGCASSGGNKAGATKAPATRQARPTDALAAFQARHAKLAGEIRATADRLIAALKKTGKYWVAEGVYRYFAIADCAALVDIAGSCYGNNPSSPYGNYWVPVAPGEWHDPEVVKKCKAYDWEGKGYARREIEIFKKLAINFQLRPDEAIVYLGLTPPEAKYFSFRSYLYDSYVARANKRKDIFAALGDSLNHHVIKTGGERPFHAKTAVITTADRNLDQRIRGLLASEMTGRINTDIIPAELTKLGYGPKKDNFVMLARAALFADKRVAAAYMKDPRAIVIRVVPKAPVGSTLHRPFPKLVQKPRQGIVELGRYGRAFRGLVQGVRRSVGQRAFPLRVQPAVLLHGPTCIKLGYNCYGDNYDAAYLISPKLAPRDAQGAFDFYAVGVIHTRSGNAEYTNISLMNASTLTGINAFSDVDFAGSVEPFLRFVPPRLRGAVERLKDHLYVVRFSRRCRGAKHCMTIPSTGGISVKDDQKMRIIVRAYVKPGTVAGPAYRKLLRPRVIRFRAR